MNLEGTRVICVASNQRTQRGITWREKHGEHRILIIWAHNVGDFARGKYNSLIGKGSRVAYVDPSASSEKSGTQIMSHERHIQDLRPTCRQEGRC